PHTTTLRTLRCLHHPPPHHIHPLSLHDALPICCLLTGERRTIPGETAEQVERELRALTDDAELRLTFSRDPFEAPPDHPFVRLRSEEHTSELQSLTNLVCRLLLEKKNTIRCNKL